MLAGGTGITLIETAPTPPRWAMSLACAAVHQQQVLLHGIIQHCTIEIATGNGATLVSASLPHASTLAAHDLQRAVREMFLTVLRTLRATDSPHAVRMWSFIPGIHDIMGDATSNGASGTLDRYRVFNIGRFEAFSEWYGGPDAFASTLAAASAVGYSGDSLCIHALGTPTPGHPIENPRQIPAFSYSAEHGPRPPCFARATIARLPIGDRLLVAGTASILGETSVHSGSPVKQFAESIQNIEALARGARPGQRFDLSSVETARVYYPRATDLPWLAEHLPTKLPAHTTIEYTAAVICRPELLVEIEMTIAPLD